MTHAVFDFSDIKRRALGLKTEPNTVNAKVYVPPQFDECGMYAGMVSVGHDQLLRGCDSENYFWSAADGCYLPVE